MSRLKHSAPTELAVGCVLRSYKYSAALWLQAIESAFSRAVVGNSVPALRDRHGPLSLQPNLLKG